MSLGFASHSTNAPVTGGAIDRPTPTIETTTARVNTMTDTPPSMLPVKAPATSDKSSLTAAFSRIDAFVQTLLFPEQRSILRDYAVRYIELFSVYYCDSKSLLRLKGNADTIPNNCKITVPLQPVEGIQGIQAYKDLAQEVAIFSTANQRVCDQMPVT